VIGSGTAQQLNSTLAEIEDPGYRPAGLNAESTSLSYLKTLFEPAGLTDVDTRPIEIELTVLFKISTIIGIRIRHSPRRSAAMSKIIPEKKDKGLYSW
jgi:hypothetical protein